MAPPRILTFNFHEPYLCLMAKIGWPLHVGRYSKPQFAREWQTQFRPIPSNIHFVDEDEWRDGLERQRYDIVIAHNELNALDLHSCPVPAILVCHNRRTYLETTVKGNREEALETYARLLRKLRDGFEFVFISESKKADYGLPGRVIPPGIDIDAYGGYSGEVREVLRVGNVMRARNLMFDVDLQEAACEGLPNKVLGEDPSIPNAQPSESFDDLLLHYRSRRCLLHVTREAYEDGYNLAMLEAMACGMPVVALANGTSPIRDGIDGFTATNAWGLRARLEHLLDDRDLAREIGARGRVTAAQKFPMEKFVENWRTAIEEAASRKPQHVRKAAPVSQPGAGGGAHRPNETANRVNILMDYVSSPFTTGRYLEWALRKRHSVLTAGPRVAESLLEAWGFRGPFPDYPKQQVETEVDGTKSNLIELLPESFQPDIYLWIDSGMQLLPEGLGRLPIPKVGYMIDTHINAERRIELARNFDYVFLAQRAQLDEFKRAGIKNVAWLPLGCSTELHDVGPCERNIDVAFVGSISEHTDKRRRDLLARIADRFPNSVIGMRWPEDMAQTYAAAKIVVNACANYDVNMRVFEALAAGALLISDDAVGLEDLFIDREHVVIYRDDEEIFELIAYYLEHDEERERIAAKGHQLAYQRHTYDQRADLMMRMVLEQTGPPDRNQGDSRFGKGGYYMCPRPEVAAHVPRFARRVLDCGCGGGEFGRSLKDRGAEEVIGIEVVEQAYHIAKTNLDRAFHGSIEEMELPFERDYFDCVVFADVLEHLVNPADALRKVAPHLNEDGLIVISIPNVRFWQTVQMHAEGRWQYEDAGIMDRTHLRFFCRSDLTPFIESAGLEVVKLQPLSMWPAERLPRDERGCLQLGRIAIGPLSDEEYEEFLVYQYLVIAGKPGVDRLAPARRAQDAGKHELACLIAAEAGNVDEFDRKRVIAKSLARLGKLVTAEELYRECMKMRPHDLANAGDLGLILIAQQRNAEARPLLETARAAEPENPRFAGALGLIALSEGDQAEALDHFLASLALEFDNEDLLRHAVSLALELNSPGEVEDALRAFCEFRPGHAEMAMSHAEVLILLQRTAEAAERLKTLLLLQPSHEKARAMLNRLRPHVREKSA